MPSLPAGRLLLLPWLAVACHTPAAPTTIRLTGHGIVAGLAPAAATSSETRRALLDHLRAQGLQVQASDIVQASVALVQVTCEIPLGTAVGSPVDARCETTASQVSLRGGELLRTELRDASGTVRAVAQGAVVVTPKTSLIGWLLSGGIVVQ